MKVEIEIPDPPAGWVYDGFRVATQGEYWFDGDIWGESECGTVFRYPVAVKAAPLWTPSPELEAVLNPGWITRDKEGLVLWFKYQPAKMSFYWSPFKGTCTSLLLIKPELLPPDTIPWDKCCFKIGGDE